MIAARSFNRSNLNVAALGDSVCLWKTDLDWTDSDVAAVSEILSPGEQKRAAAFHRCLDQKRFVVARAVLRLLLARYLDVLPKKICFAYNDFGKPRLHQRQTDLDVRFSIAHSGGTALYAFAVGLPVGVDLEFIQPDFASVEIAQRSFARSEMRALSKLMGNDFVDAFYRCWTRKEAYLKATGFGLSLPLDTFSVSVNPASDQELRVQADHYAVQGPWRLMDVLLGNGFAAALCFGTRKGCISDVGAYRARRPFLAALD